MVWPVGGVAVSTTTVHRPFGCGKDLVRSRSPPLPSSYPLEIPASLRCPSRPRRLGPFSRGPTGWEKPQTSTVRPPPILSFGDTPSLPGSHPLRVARVRGGGQVEGENDRTQPPPSRLTEWGRRGLGKKEPLFSFRSISSSVWVPDGGGVGEWGGGRSHNPRWFRCIVVVVVVFATRTMAEQVRSTRRRWNAGTVRNGRGERGRGGGRNETGNDVASRGRMKVEG